MRIVDEMRLPIATVVTLAVAILGLSSSIGWIGNPFAGFLVLENGVVASAGLARWPAVQDGSIYQAEIVSVDGVAIDDVSQIHSIVRSVPVATPIRYVLSHDGGQIEQIVKTRIFDSVDFFMLFGVYLLGGLAMCGVALALIFMRRGDPVAEGTAVALWIIGMWGLTATDLYGPYLLFRFHAGLECMLFAGCIHLAMTFPYPHRMLTRSPWLIASTYGLGAVLALVMQVGLYDPNWYIPLHRIAIGLLGVSLAALIVSQILAWRSPPTFQAKQRVKVLMIGIVFACVPNLALLVVSSISGGRVSENAMGYSGVFLPLAIGYAVLRTNLFEVDRFVRRTLNYAASSMVLTGLYATAIAVVEQLIQGRTLEQRGQLLVATSAIALFALLPLRDRLQWVIDRLFFRNGVDLRRIIDTTSERLASVAELGIITAEMTHAVQSAVQPEWTMIEVFESNDLQGRKRLCGAMPDSFQELCEASNRDLDQMCELDGALAIPIHVEDRLVARLLVGPRRSARFFDGEDRRFLRTLCNHGGIAIENSMALERLRELNQTLERKVNDRTEDLSDALRDLRETQDHMMHQEKLASVGRLVAGIAHEINNPVNFIGGNLDFLREHTAVLKGLLVEYEALVAAEAPQLEPRLRAIAERAELDFVMEDLESIFAACHEGVARTTTIVSDLKTFSRSDSRQHGWVDLGLAIESTLSLLRGRLGRVEIVREFDQVPRLFAVEGQIKQVMMNLVGNALDAMNDRGRLILRLHVDGDSVIAEIEDNGAGIEEETLEHIFDPFFTTKEIGKGTGLGLSISYGAIVDHCGSLRVKSEPGKTCFTIALPIDKPADDKDQPNP